MGSRAYSNIQSIETSLNGTVTHALDRPSRHIEIINDSGTDDLLFKFADSHSFITLKPTEAWSAEIWVKQILLSTSASVEYRLRIMG